MQVFFYVDPAILKDPSLANARTLSLSYTFFKTGDDDAEAAAQGGKGGFDVGAAQAAHASTLEAMREQRDTEAGGASGAAVPAHRSPPPPTVLTVPGGSYDPVPPRTGLQRERIAEWTRETAEKMGIKLPPSR